MQVRNLSARPYHIGGKILAPLDVVEIDDSFKTALVDMIKAGELEEVKKAEVKKDDK